jgi:hypothetical protein
VEELDDRAGAGCVDARRESRQTGQTRFAIDAELAGPCFAVLRDVRGARRDEAEATVGAAGQERELGVAEATIELRLPIRERSERDPIR